MWGEVVAIKMLYHKENPCRDILNSHSLFMTFWHKAFMQIMKIVRDYIFDCLH